MGSVGGVEELPAGVTGEDTEVGALVWVRRRNGSWWPGRILGQDELPENCVVPPRSAGTPIKLLGRPDGSIDWYNLDKSKRVKAFRCGEYEECIEKAKYLAHHQKRAYNEGKYVRREDAIMHALEIERSRFPYEDEMNDAASASQNSWSANSMKINGSSKRSSRIARDLYDIEENSAHSLSPDFMLCKLPQNLSSSSTRYASSSRKKRKTSNNFKVDMDDGFRRMRDLGEIGSVKFPKQKTSSYVFLNGHQGLPLLESGPSFGYDLSNNNGIRKSKQSHSLTKRKRSNIGQANENSRKKDRRHPLSKLCTDSAVTAPKYCHWDPSGQSSGQYPEHKRSNKFESSRGKSALLMDMNNFSYSSGPSNAGTLVDASCTNRTIATKAVDVKEVEVSCRTGFPGDDCFDDDEFSDAPLTIENDILEDGHLHKHISCPSVKDQVLKQEMQATEYSEESIPSFRDNKSSMKKSIHVKEECCNRTQNSLVQQYEMTIKYQAPDEDVIGFNTSLCKHTDLRNKEHAVIPADACADVMRHQYYKGEPEHQDSSETKCNNLHHEMVTAASQYHGLPLQVILLDQKPDLKSARYDVANPNKTGHHGKLYDVELMVEGSYKGHRAPLVSLMSKWNGKPIVGFPIPVQVLDDSCPAESSDDHHPETSSLNHLLKGSEFAEPRQPRSSYASRSKSGGRKKISEHDMDKSWRPHTKRSASSPRKMRRLSSFVSSRRERGNEKLVVGNMFGAAIACIPLRLVFSRINEALQLPVRSENPNRGALPGFRNEESL